MTATARFCLLLTLALAVALVAGGTAGRFSAWVPGWPFRGAPSRLVLKRVRLPGRV